MPRKDLTVDVVGRFLSALAGGGLLYASGVTAGLAREHMAVLGSLCGAASQTPHCAWCFAAAGLAVAALTAFGFAIRSTAAQGLAAA